jgi:uncharacterized DUF497 family protein
MVTYDENKRRLNLSRHGIDFAECGAIYERPMLTDEDIRDAYGEVRLKSIGWLQGCVVVLIWTERESDTRLISCRYGDKDENSKYFRAFF